MEGQNRADPLRERSLEFAVRIVGTARRLRDERREFALADQLLRSGTSIGANINEANYAQSRSDFIFKLHIALKETAETEYWIRLLFMSDYIGQKLGDSLLGDCLELKRILVASINTARENKDK